MKDLDLSNLNEGQKKPVVDTEGQLLVVAGAGSGKTRVLTYRVAYLLKYAYANPHEILAITFTNKAANEMKARISHMLGEDAGIWVSTFHSMANRILRNEIAHLGYSTNFSIYAESDVERVIKRILQNKRIEDAKLLSKIRWHISSAKNYGGSIDAYFNENCKSKNDERVYEIYEAYESEMRTSNALDFDDLLLKTSELFMGFPEVLSKYSKRFRYIHIDEFQDTNKIQYDLLKMLASHHGNIFAVGDDDQSIYGFRGADVSNMFGFQRDYPDHKLYKLERNYRSVGNILDVANVVISHNSSRIDKKLWTETGAGDRPVIKENPSDRDEADFVINKIGELLTSGYSLKDIAVLVRQNSLTRLFEEKLNLYGYPYKLFGGYRFYERKEIRDVVSYMKMISNPKDRDAILRIINFPKRGIGDTLIGKLNLHAEAVGADLIDVVLGIENNAEFSGLAKSRLLEFKNIVQRLIDASLRLPLYEYVTELVKIAGFEAYYKSAGEEEAERYDNIIEFVNAVREFAKDNPGASAEEFLQSVSLVSDIEDPEGNDALTLATIHSVKGLEFKIVFIVGLEERLFPSQRSIDEGGEEEERRVMYVAITRAKERLFATYAKTRFRFNEVVYSNPSRFIGEMCGINSVIYDRPYSYGGRSRAGGRFAAGYGGGSPSFSGVSPSFGGDSFNRSGVKSEAKPAESLFSLYAGSQESEKKPAVGREEYDKYKPGAKVSHKRFGEGTVIKVSGAGSDMSADIAFKGLGVKKFNVALAPLKIIE